MGGVQKWEGFNSTESLQLRVSPTCSSCRRYASAVLRPVSWSPTMYVLRARADIRIAKAKHAAWASARTAKAQLSLV